MLLAFKCVFVVSPTSFSIVEKESVFVGGRFVWVSHVFFQTSYVVEEGAKKGETKTIFDEKGSKRG
jgi:hypothetical protein